MVLIIMKRNGLAIVRIRPVLHIGLGANGQDIIKLVIGVPTPLTLQRQIQIIVIRIIAIKIIAIKTIVIRTIVIRIIAIRIIVIQHKVILIIVMERILILRVVQEHTNPIVQIPIKHVQRMETVQLKELVNILHILISQMHIKISEVQYGKLQ